MFDALIEELPVDASFRRKKAYRGGDHKTIPERLTVAPYDDFVISSREGKGEVRYLTPCGIFLSFLFST